VDSGLHLAAEYGSGPFVPHSATVKFLSIWTGSQRKLTYQSRIARKF